MATQPLANLDATTKSSINTILKKYGANMVSQMAAILSSKNKLASGNLIRSLKYDVVNDVELVISFLDYGKWVNYGRLPGKYAPVKAIEDWCRIKGISTSLAYPINRKIFKFGITPAPFFQPFYDNFTFIEKQILYTMGKDVLDALKLTLDKEITINLKK